MYTNKPSKVVFFDLDNILFDHLHSLRSAILAVRQKHTYLLDFDIDRLVDAYNGSLQQAYEEYLDRTISYQEADVRKIQLFFASLGLSEPSIQEITDVRNTYKSAYRRTRRATPGSMETLFKLRQNGYLIAVITNGQIIDQKEKVEDIGLHHLVDRIITSEEAGYRKPDPRIFSYAAEALGVPLDATTCMIGDSAESDIKGAVCAGLSAIMYSPMAQDSRRVLFGKEIGIIRHMDELLGCFRISS